MLCLVDALFRNFSPGGCSARDRRRADISVAIKGRSFSELQISSVLAPMIRTVIAASYAPRLVSTDASPSGRAAVQTPVSHSIHQELWRRRDTRGVATYLKRADVAAVLELDDVSLTPALSSLSIRPIGRISS